MEYLLNIKQKGMEYSLILYQSIIYQGIIYELYLDTKVYVETSV